MRNLHPLLVIPSVSLRAKRSRKELRTAILSLAFAAGPCVAFAQNPGSLDLSFDPGAGANNVVESTAIQNDGRIVIGGVFSSYDGTSRNGIARLNEDGSLDTTFDPVTGTGGFYPYVRTAAIQSDGRIIIGGAFTSYNGTPRNGIARLNVDGSLDSTFDPGGGVVGGTDPDVKTIALQGDGKIVIGGDFTSYNGTPRNYIARLHCEGTVGEDGRTSHEFSIFPNPASTSVTIVMPEQPGHTELVMRNSLGQQVLRGTVASGRNDVPLSGLAPGLYTVEVAASAVRRTQRLVVE